MKAILKASLFEDGVFKAKTPAASSAAGVAALSVGAARGTAAVAVRARQTSAGELKGRSGLLKMKHETELKTLESEQHKPSLIRDGRVTADSVLNAAPLSSVITAVRCGCHFAFGSKVS